MVISVINRKGGVGKTATAQALGTGLKKRGYSVLFVDLDSQANLTYSLGVKADKGSMDLLRGTLSLDDAIVETPQGDLIPATGDLAIADTILTDTGKEYKLKEALEGANYDFIVIDTPAALGSLTVNALVSSDKAIITVQADIYSLQGIGLMNEPISAVKKYCNNSLLLDGLLVTRYNGRATISKDMMENLEKVAAELGTRVYDQPIRECIAVKEAQALQQSIFEYAPKSNAAQDYNAFIDQFLK